MRCGQVHEVPRVDCGFRQMWASGDRWWGLLSRSLFPPGRGWGRSCGRSRPAALSLKSPLCGWERPGKTGRTTSWWDRVESLHSDKGQTVSREGRGDGDIRGSRRAGRGVGRRDANASGQGSSLPGPAGGRPTNAWPCC